MSETVKRQFYVPGHGGMIPISNSDSVTSYVGLFVTAEECAALEQRCAVLEEKIEIAACDWQAAEKRHAEVVADMRKEIELAKQRCAALERERDALSRELERHASIEEKAHLQTIDERDAAEEALSQAYYLIVGRSPEWSNLFGHDEAINEIAETQRLLRTILTAAEQRAEIAERALDQIRGAVLNERFAMAENGMTSDQVNDVLAVIDQFDPRLAAE